ncbi:MAG: PTS transporter subunit IIC [Actinomycetales bacterium]
MIQDVFVAIADNLLGQVPILIGLVTLLGLVLQRKGFSDVVGGTLRSAIGVVIMLIGIEVFVGGLANFQTIVSSAVGLEPPPSTTTLDDFLAGTGSVAPLIIAGGFALHLVLVRVFRAARYVYLTGHLMFWMSAVVAASLVEVFGAGVDRWTLIGAGSLVLGCYLTLQPLWTEPLMRKVVGHDNFALAHTTSTLALATGYGARALKLGDPVKHDTEKLKIPSSVAFLKDMNVATALVIGVIMLISLIFADSQTVATVTGDTAPVAWALVQAMRFAGGIAILLFGVRMFLAEIVPSFKGISDRLLPGSMPALDIPVVFPKAPTAVMLGFLTSTVVFLALMGLFAGLGWFVLVPPMIMLFFGGGAGGVFGNAVAGWRGAVFGGVLNGLLLGFGQWFFWGLFADTAPQLATLADPDWFAVGGLIMLLGSLVAPIGSAGIWVTSGGLLAFSALVLLVLGRRDRKASSDSSAQATPAGTTSIPS